jgi:hypothetical protein
LAQISVRGPVVALLLLWLFFSHSFFFFSPFRLDGSVATPFDTSRLDYLTEALLADGFSESEIRAIMGENAKNFLLKWLPAN